MDNASEESSPDTPLVTVLQTDEPGLLPLARIALEQAGIDYTVENRDLIIGYPSVMTEGETKASLEVLVRAEDAARARELLRDLESAEPGAPNVALAPAATIGAATAAGGPASIALFDVATGAPIGHLTDAQFDSISEHLELESSDDDDYYIDEPTLVMLQDQQADAGAIELLRRALGTRAGMDVRWSRE